MNTTLTLQVTPTETGISTPSDCTFDGVEGSIGRNVSNTWVLPDSTKHLSGKHAVIGYSNDGYQLTDTSTNGVFVNNSTYALGRENSVLLKAGDTLRMGPYQIKVVLVESPSMEVITNDSDDFFTDSSMPIAESYFPVKESDTLATSTPPSLFPEQESNASIENLEEDWWSDSSSPSNSSHTENNPSFNPVDDDFDNLFDGIANGNSSNTFLDTEKERESTKADDILAKDPLKEVLSTETKIVRPKPALRPIKKPSNYSTESNKRSESPTSPLADHDLRRSPLQQPESPAPPSTKKTKNTQSTEIDVITAFLKGAGIHDPDVQVRIATHLDFEILGKMFQTAVKGTIDVLRSRTDIKSEMRMDMTVIQPIQNNPLKFSISLEDTLIRLMTTQKEAYMTPERAMTEAYDDIKAHQIAVMAGVQVTLHTLLKRFQPDNLTQRLEKESPIAANIPFHRQAKLWKHFEYLYETIEQEAEEDFERLFGAEFAKAYEQQIIKLKGQQ